MPSDPLFAWFRVALKVCGCDRPLTEASTSPKRSPKTSEAACTEYRADLHAIEFGTCVCGRPKAQHTEEVLSPDKKKASPTKADRLAAAMRRKSFTATCTSYRENLTANTFGICVCGLPRAEHDESALQPARSPRRNSEADLALKRALDANKNNSHRVLPR